MAALIIYSVILGYAYLEGTEILRLVGVETGYLMNYWIPFAGLWGLIGFVEGWFRGTHGQFLFSMASWVTMSSIVLFCQALLISFDLNWFSVNLMVNEFYNGSAAHAMFSWHFVFTIVLLICRHIVTGFEVSKEITS